MSFALAPWLVGAGLLALAGALYALQRLRVRHRELRVVTTLFWRQATEERRARVLFWRFRHLPAYLLLLAIASVLWLGVAGPRVELEDADAHVLLLDASAAMGAGRSFQDAVVRLTEAAAALPAARREVWFCGGRVETLLAPGESALLLADRLAGLTPEAAPSALARAARTARQIHGPDVRLHVFGGEAAASDGATALGVAAARSGRWDAVDVFV
ncbi:MAG: hypothetical protein O2894_13765, partial [Planctomycetota bacterium]|nr:hypothetical protein [Planctomycetota bacterium]